MKVKMLITMAVSGLVAASFVYATPTVQLVDDMNSNSNSMTQSPGTDDNNATTDNNNNMSSGNTSNNGSNVQSPANSLDSNDETQDSAKGDDY